MRVLEVSSETPRNQPAERLNPPGGTWPRPPGRSPLPSPRLWPPTIAKSGTQPWLWRGFRVTPRGGTGRVSQLRPAAPQPPGAPSCPMPSPTSPSRRPSSPAARRQPCGYARNFESTDPSRTIGCRRGRVHRGTAQLLHCTASGTGWPDPHRRPRLPEGAGRQDAGLCRLRRNHPTAWAMRQATTAWRASSSTTRSACAEACRPARDQRFRRARRAGRQPPEAPRATASR